MKPHNWILFLFLSYNCLFSQSNDTRYQLTWVNTEDGLRQLSAKSCVVDSYGFVWIATQLGLYRYDGLNLVEIRDANYPSISKQRISRLGKDPFTGKIYFEVWPDNNKYVIENDFKLKKINLKESIQQVIFTSNYSCYTNTNPTVTNFLLLSNVKKILSEYSDYIPANASLIDDNLYLLLRDKLLIYKNKKELNSYPLDPVSKTDLLHFGDKILILNNHKITMFYEGKIQKEIVSVDEKINIYLNRKIFDQSNIEIFTSNRSCYLKYNFNVYKIEFADGRLFTKFLFKSPSNDITSISFLEKENIFFIGTTTHGMAVLKPILFNSVLFKEDNLNKSINYCYSIIPTSQENWYCTSGWKFNSTLKKYSKDYFHTDDINVRFILPYKKSIYIQAGKKLYNLKTRKPDCDFSIPQNSQKQSLNFTGYAYLKGILYLSDSKSIWVLKNNKLNAIDLSKVSYIQDHITGVFAVNDILIITTERGLFSLNPDTNEIQVVIKKVYSRYVKSIDSKSYWVGCYGDGLFYVHSNKAYKVRGQSLNITTVHAIEEDKKGNYWMSTNDGLLKTQKKNIFKAIIKNKPLDFYVYTKDDGLPTNEFNGSGTHPSLNMKSGIIGFPSMQGFVYFDSNSILKHHFDSKINVDKVIVDNTKIIPLQKGMYIIPKEANLINFKFSYSYFFNRKNISVSYKFKNQPKWTKITGNTIQISRYKKGEQQLILKINTNTFGINKAVIKKVRIYFEERYYELFGFWILISIVVIAILVGLYLLLFNFQRNKNSNLQLLIKEKTYELNQTVIQLESSNNSVIKTLAEKEILLKEIHHRVKNNLQLVMSLLNIQAQDSKNISIDDFLNKGRSRIATMSLIHQNLYENSSLSKINFQNYLENLVKNILNTFNENSVTIEVNTNGNDFDIDTAIPLGLIINELVCNSLKHAFKDNQEGVISIYILKVDSSNFILEIGDNGVGISKKSHRENSIGLEIVSLLVMQLRGKIHTIDKPGTNYRIEFKDANK